MYCSSCGNQLSDQAVVCPKCGAATPNFSKKEEGDGVSSGAIAAFYIVGAIIPIIGWVGAVYLLVKGKVGHAIGVAALSIFMPFFWIGVLDEYL